MDRGPRRTALALTLAVAATLAFGASAYASTAQVDTVPGATRLTVDGDDDAARDEIDISYAGGVLTVADRQGIVPGSGCTGAGPTEVRCETSLESQPFGSVELSGHGGDDRLRILTALPNGVGAGIWGGDGHDDIDGSPAADRLFPEAGEDHVIAMGGEDYVAVGDPDEDDTFDLGEGIDTLSYNQRATGVTFTMSGLTAGTGWAGSGSESDALVGVERLYGTNADDTFHGGPGDEDVFGLGGHDDLYGNAGDDILVGGPGEDLVAGGSGDDDVEGSADPDTLLGGDDDDVVRAEDGLQDVIACDDPDGAVAGAADVVYRDDADPDDPTCDVVAPQFTGNPAITGEVRVGSTLAISGAATTGTLPVTYVVTWWSCATVARDDCLARDTAPTYVPGAADVGRFLYAEVIARNGGESWAETPFTGGVASAPQVIVDPVEEDPPGDTGGQATQTQTQTQTQQVPSLTPVQPAAPVLPRPTAPAPMTPRQLAQALLTSALRAFGGETLATFVKDGTRVPFTADAPGLALVQVYEGAAPRAIAAATRRPKPPIASGRRVFTRSGSGVVKVTLTPAARKRLRGKRSVRVVIRTVFVPRGGKPVASDRKLTLRR